jgi:RHS repeat-associated protein
VNGSFDVVDLHFICVDNSVREKCHNGKDDDHDGLTDCQDLANCKGVPDCRPDISIGPCGAPKSPIGGGYQSKEELIWNKGNSACQCSKETKKPCEPTDGEPVEVNSGRLTDAREDLMIPGRFPVAVAPFYRSNSDYLGVHGYGYSSILTARLIRWDDSSWSLRDERGDREDFDATGKNLNHKIAMGNLLLSGDSAYWEPMSGRVYAFTRKEGVLGTIRDRKGGGVRFTYADSAGVPYRLPIKGISYSAWPPKFRGVIAMDFRVNRLADLDNTSRFIDFSYDTTGLLVSATDFSGRKVDYTYDLAGNQTKVTFPDGTARRFFYQDTAKFHRLTAFDAKPIRGSMASDTAILTRNEFDGKNRVASQTFQGSSYGFDHAAWRDSTFHELGSRFGEQMRPNAVMRIIQYFRSTTVSQIVPDGRGGTTTRAVVYDDLVENGAQQDTGSGNLLDSIHWLSRVLREKEIVGTDTLYRTTVYDKYNNVIGKTEPEGTQIQFFRDTLSRVYLQKENPTAGRGSARYIRYVYDGKTDRILRQVNGTSLDSTVTEWTYDANGNALTESVWGDPAVKISTSKSYDALGRVLTETDAFGKTTKNVYLSTSSFQPDSVQFPDTTGERYTRDAMGRITQTKNQLGQVKWNAYDVLGRETLTCGYDSLCARRTYNGPDLVLLEEGLMANASGGYGAALRVSMYDVDGYGRRVKEWMQSGFRWVLKRKLVLDAMGNELEVWDNPDSTNSDSTRWRLVERKVFDGRNHLRELRQFPSGPGYDSLVTLYKPDAMGHVASETDARMATTKRTVDPWGNVVSDTDAVARVTKRLYDHRSLVVLDSNALNMVTSHTYDAQGNETHRIGWHADTSLWIYDRGRLIKERTAEGRWTTYLYDVRGRVLRVAQKVGDTALAVDSNDVFTDYAYDKLGRRIKETLRGVVQHRYGYDAGGRVIADTNALGLRTTYAYEALGRQTDMTLPSGDVVSTSYDAQGRASVRRIGADTLSVTRYDDADRPIWERTPGAGAITRTYDQADYVTRIVDSANIATTLTQDRMGRDSLASVAGKTARRTVRDAAGRVTEQWDERGYKAAMSYDAQDRLVSLEDNENDATEFVYVDSAGGWRRTTTYPDAKTESHVYDREGRLRRFVDGRGIQSVYKYDSLSRLTGIDYLNPNGTTAATSVSLRYDRLGRLSNASQGTASVDSSTYDDLGQVLTSLQTVAGTVYTLSYAYDPAQRTRTLTLPDGSTVKQKWTPRGLLDSLWSGSKLVARYGYKASQEVSRTLSNGIDAAATYDLAGRPTGMSYTLAGQAHPSLGYGYDASGNRSLIRRNHSTTTSEAVTYTPDNQVSAWGKGTADASGVIASPTSSQNWTLDSRGNWTGWTQNGTAQARTHSAANELTTIGATSLTWDLAGNLTNDGALSYVWGSRGLLDTAKQGATVKGSYGYDPLGRRALKTVGAIKTISVYDGWQCVYQKVTGSGTDTAKIFTYGNYIDEPVTMVRKWGTSSDTVWYLQGNNYNVEALTDRTGVVVERYEYTPYGKPTVYTGAGTDGKWFTSDDVSATVSAKGNALTFQGRELDAETGAMYFRNRNYSAGMGRFVSRDKLRYDANDINYFRFVYNSPLVLRDSSGNSTIGFVSPCDGYPKGSSCKTPCSDMSGTGSTPDTYTDRAKSICNQFVVMYHMGPRVKAAASCLANAEKGCQKLGGCRDRSKCRLKAHYDCYTKTKFLNDAIERLTWTNPFPDAGWEIGLFELLPEALGKDREVKCCQK